MDGITESKNMNLSKLQETVKDREARCVQSLGLQKVRHDLATEQQQQVAKFEDSLYKLRATPGQ